MTDIVEELRTRTNHDVGHGYLYVKAADEIERLRAQSERLIKGEENMLALVARQEDKIERLRAALREALPCLVRQYEDEAADIVRVALEAKP